MHSLHTILKVAGALLLFFTVSVSIAATGAMAGNFYQTKWQAYDPIVRGTANRYGIDPRLVHAVIWQESNYNSRAVSSAGAQGLMQLMPDTANDLGVRSPFRARQNIDGGIRYLVEQLQRFGSTKLALQAYHCGPERVAKGRVPSISVRYANQVIARFLHIKKKYPTRKNNPSVLIAFSPSQFK